MSENYKTIKIQAIPSTVVILDWFMVAEKMILLNKMASWNAIIITYYLAVGNDEKMHFFYYNANKQFNQLSIY